MKELTKVELALRRIAVEAKGTMLEYWLTRLANECVTIENEELAAIPESKLKEEVTFLRGKQL